MQEINHSANPFPGLRPFESTETHLFFGRDGQSEELLRRLKRTRFLAVVGTSGSGKSSLVRAGLLPALQGGLMASAGSDWRIAILRPGNDPMGNLARALASPTVLGLGGEKSAGMQDVLAETTLRRSSLGLVELVSRARTKLGERGQPLFHDYENLLVVVDQFEEIFRFKQLIEEENSKEDAAAFVKLLLEAVRQAEGKIYVVLTMRSDFLGDCARFWELPEAINNGQYLIPRMTRDERREAISGPVAVGQGAISEPLVNQLLNDVGDNPDQLPILQHALMRTWDYWLSHRRNGEPIDISDYNAIGGMAEALSLHADEAYEELTVAQKLIAEKLFKGLTEKGADNREIRRPMELPEICELTGADEAAVIAVIEVFRREGRSFLMPPPTDAVTGAPVPLNSESLIDISHESLIRNWERLKGWVDEESQSARIYKRLAETAMLHKAGEEALLKDPALQVGLDWRGKNRPNRVWARRYHPEFETALTFLDTSVAARDAELRELERQQKRETSYKRSKLTATILGLAFILSLASLTFAYSRLSQAKTTLKEAQSEREKAVSAATQARKQAMMAGEQAMMARDESAQAKSEREAAQKAQRVADEEKQIAVRARTHAEEQADIAARQAHESNLAKKIAINETNKAIEAQRQSLHLLKAADINLAQQAYESSNIERVRELLQTHAPGPSESPGFEWYYLRHLLQSEKATLKPSPGLVLSTTSPVGNTLVIGSGPEIELRNIGAGETNSRKFTIPDDFSIGSLAISPDGKILAVGKSDADTGATVRLYDLESLKERGSLRKDADAANSLVFSGDGKRIIVGGSDGSVMLLDIDSARPPETLPAKGTVFLDASRDGKMIAAGSMDSEANTFPVLLWDISAKEKAAKELLGHGGKITAVAFSPDGKTLATGSLDKTVRLWDTQSRRPLRVLSFNSSVFSLAFTPDGHFLAVGCQDGSIKLYNAEKNLDGPSLIGHHQAITSLSFSSDGKLLFSSDNKISSAPDDDSLTFEPSPETGIKVWDVARLLREQTPFQVTKGSGAAWDILREQVAYSPDGKTLATVIGLNVFLLDAETNEVRKTLADSELTFTSLAFSPDGKLIATGEERIGPPTRNNRDRTSEHAVRFWNAATGSLVGKPLEHEGSVTSLAFSADSKLLATGDAVGKVKIWDTASSKLLAESQGEIAAQSLSFLPNGSLACYSNGVLELWDLKLEKSLSRFKTSGEGKEGMVSLSQVSLSHDGRVLAGSHDDGTAVLYDTATGRQLASLKCQAEGAFPLAFSSDDKILVTGGSDGILKLWDMASHRELLTFKGLPYAITSVTFSADGTKLATLDAYNHVRVWRAPRNGNVTVSTKPLSGLGVYLSRHSEWKPFPDLGRWALQFPAFTFKGSTTTRVGPLAEVETGPSCGS